MYGPTRERNNSGQCEVLRHELAGLRIQRLELEQQDPRHPQLQAWEAAIRVREQQLERAAAGAANPRGTGGCTQKWQVRVVAKQRMVDWSDMNGSFPCGEGFLACRKLYEDVRYIAWPEGKDSAWALARSGPKTLAKWKELFARVDLDVVEMNQDMNVVQTVHAGGAAARAGPHTGLRVRAGLSAPRVLLWPAASAALRVRARLDVP